ncbi:right-handed parallel beta-helix repeat-containing protein, partial [Bacillus sp. SIMBA_069]
MAIIDNATIGLFAWSTNATLSHLTIARNGMLGFGGNSAYGLKATGLLVADNNNEHFKKEPLSGGFKITRSRGISTTDSAFLRNATTGLWLDESVYDAAVTGNDFVSNGGDGVEAEISAHVTIANNVARDN